MNKHGIRKGEILEFPKLNKAIKEHLENSEEIIVKAPLIDHRITDEMCVLRIKEIERGIFEYNLPESSEIEKFIESQDIKNKKRGNSVEIRIKVEEWIRDAILRCGLREHSNLDDDVMRFIKNYDDVILAPDTNILLNCIFTSILLPKIREKMDEEPKGCPNWMLIAVPKLVMYEIERKAVRRFTYKEYPERAGWLKYDGRIGQRALQEILVLDTNISYRGLSIMTIGEIPPNYESFMRDVTRWDAEIRAQIRNFISSINFHKGIFFITQDRVNAMMARAEGLQSLFLQKPIYEDLFRHNLRNKNACKVIYEMIVTFGEIEIEGLAGLSIFWPEKHVSDWERSRVFVTEVK